MPLFGVFDGTSKSQKRTRDDEVQGSQKRAKASKEYVRDRNIFL
jgi:hypothetical protein